MARDQKVRAGDIIVSRHNDAGLTVAPGAPRREGDRIDQVRNGNRWRVIGVDTRQVRIAAEWLTDSASLDRNDQRCAARTQAWRQHEAQTHAREAAFERITAASHQRR